MAKNLNTLLFVANFLNMARKAEKLRPEAKKKFTTRATDEDLAVKISIQDHR